MINQILSWIMANNKAKIGVGALSASGMIVLALGLNNVTNAKIDKGAINQKAYMREYVQLSLKPIESEIKHINTEQKEIKMLVKEIRDHLINNR